MGDTRLILFELRVDGDLQIGPKSIDGGGDTRLPAVLGRKGESGSEEESESGGRLSPKAGAGGAVLALGLLAGLGLALRFLRGKSEGTEAEEGLEVGLGGD